MEDADTRVTTVQFQDESRLIASEYQGGLGRYPRLDQNTVVTPPHETELNATLRVVAQKQDAGAGKTYRSTDNDVAPGLGEQQDVVDSGSGAGLIIKLSPDQPTYDGSQLFQPQDLQLRNGSDNPFTMRVKISQVSTIYCQHHHPEWTFTDRSFTAIHSKGWLGFASPWVQEERGIEYGAFFSSSWPSKSLCTAHRPFGNLRAASQSNPARVGSHRNKLDNADYPVKETDCRAGLPQH